MARESARLASDRGVGGSTEGEQPVAVVLLPGARCMQGTSKQRLPGKVEEKLRGPKTFKPQS